MTAPDIVTEARRLAEWETSPAARWVLARLVAEVERLRHELDAAQLRSIEARNPGIDMDEVRQVRARLLGGDQ